MLFYREIFSQLPVLTTERLILRKMKLSDAQDLFAYAQDPQVSRHVLWEAHTSVRQSRQFLRMARRQYRRGQPCSWAITLKDSGRMIGTIGFMWLNTDWLSAEVGYSLSREYWNQGLMTEALRAVIAFGFDTLGLQRIEAQHTLGNPASGRVMQHVGMQYEGTLRQRVKNKGKYQDVKLFAILRTDPRL